MDNSFRNQAKKQSEICHVFGNISRVLILWTLAEGEKTVSDIATAIGCSMQNTSQHLRLMKDKRILFDRRDGSSVYYRINRLNPMENCLYLLHNRPEAVKEPGA